MSDEIEICAGCSNPFYLDEMTERDGAYVCSDCVSNLADTSTLRVTGKHKAARSDSGSMRLDDEAFLDVQWDESASVKTFDKQEKKPEFEVGADESWDGEAYESDGQEYDGPIAEDPAATEQQAEPGPAPAEISSPDFAEDSEMETDVPALQQGSGHGVSSSAWGDEGSSAEGSWTPAGVDPLIGEATGFSEEGVASESEVKGNELRTAFFSSIIILVSICVIFAGSWWVVIRYDAEYERADLDTWNAAIDKELRGEGEEERQFCGVWTLAEAVPLAITKTRIEVQIRNLGDTTAELRPGRIDVILSDDRVVKPIADPIAILPEMPSVTDSRIVWGSISPHKSFKGWIFVESRGAEIKEIRVDGVPFDRR